MHIANNATKEDAYAPFFARHAPPVFYDPLAERLHRRQRLAGAFRALAAFGHGEGVAGHITARDPLEPDTFWVNPFGLNFAHIRASDCVRVDGEGRVVEGGSDINVSAFAIHAQIHLARPDVIAAVHAHSVHGRAWAAQGRVLGLVCQEACAFFEDHVFIDDRRVLVTEADEGRDLALALGNAKAAILRNHGLLTVGRTVEEAAWWFLSMDRCCQIQILAESVGKPLEIDASNARATRAVNGSARVAWFQFQPLWDDIVRRQPEVLQ